MEFKKRFLLFLIFLFLIPLSTAGEDWMYNSRDLTMDIGISSYVEIVPLNTNYNVLWVKANLSLFPRETPMQGVLSLTTTPESDKNGFLVFKWDNPGTNKLDFLVNSKVNVKNDIVKIKSKVPFPIENLSADYLIYTKPTKNIDSDNKEIIKLASGLAEGESDAYIVLNKLATWVETNIQYNLTTSTASVSQPASWVLTNRKGVCDELTSLFIAMARSVGIPARFVSGVAYTNYQDLNNWGPHAWAEIYIPDYGWIPYDVTYKELGFIDPTHITLKQSLDSDESSTIYESYGQNVNLKTGMLEIETKLVGTGPRTAPQVSLDVDIIKKNIGFGSYNLVEVKIKNLEEYYVTTSLSLAEVCDLKLIGEENRNTVLKPKDEVREYFIVQLDKDLKRNFIYTIPIQAYTTRNISAQANFKSTADGPVYSLEEMEEILKSKKEEETKVYSKEISFKCDPDKDWYYIEEKPTIACQIKNKGNVLLEDLEVCLEKKCEKIDLGISQEKELNFELELKEEVEKDFPVTAKNKDVSKTVYVKINVLDKPRIEVVNVESPSSVSYNEKFFVAFTLNKSSRSDPKNVVILFKDGFPKKWTIEDFTKDSPLGVKMKGSDLDLGENKIEIKITYEDERKREYETTKEISIKLENVIFSQRVKIFFKNIGKSILNLFS